MSGEGGYGTQILRNFIHISLMRNNEGLVGSLNLEPVREPGCWFDLDTGNTLNVRAVDTGISKSLSIHVHMCSHVYTHILTHSPTSDVGRMKVLSWNRVQNPGQIQLDHKALNRKHLQLQGIMPQAGHQCG